MGFKRCFLGILIFFFFILGPSEVVSGSKSILLATTTSLQDSGLLDVLLPLFEKKTGYFVKTLAVGSGQAIVMGRRGEADLLLVHSEEEELKFVGEGYGIHRRPVMYNDFVIVGPPEDPVRIKEMRSALESFKKIALAKSLFLSRGDHSGTHIKEKEIWKGAGIQPLGEKWYQETGLGMGQTLSIASEKRGYTLTDRGTYLALKKNLSIVLLVQRDKMLFNPYHVIEVNPAKWAKVNTLGAKSLSEFLVSKESQEVIKTFGLNQFGSSLFFPYGEIKEERTGPKP